MKKLSCILASLPLITTACGGGGSDSPQVYEAANTTDLSLLKGIWSDTEVQTYTSPSGKQTTFQAPTGIVSSEKQMIILTGNSELYVIEPNSDTAHFFSSFAYSTPVTPSLSLTNSNFLFSYYNPKRDAKGAVAIPADGHYDSVINIPGLMGDWNDTYASSPTWIFTFSNDGSFTADKQSAGCTASGQFTAIDPTKSELAVSITFNSNCGTLQNTHTGLAWPDEGLPDTLLNIAVYSGFDISAKAIGWKILKQ